MDNLKIIGKPITRVDIMGKVTGKAIYTTDLKFPGMLFGKVLRSPYPHAKVLNIDTSRAARLLGVKGVVIGKDFEFTYGNSIQDQPYYCWDEVRYIGDPVAGVAAIDEDTAEEALSLIMVDYEELPAVTDVLKAMEPNSPLVHENMINYWRAPGIYPIAGTNICNHVKIRRGDIDEGFKKADYVFEDLFRTPAVQHCHLEPHVSIAMVDPSGKITIWTSNQFPYTARRELMNSLKIPANKIRIIVPEVGGAFGGKFWAKTEALSAALALKLKKGRPVKVSLTRQEEFTATSGVRHQSIIKLKTGVKRDGRLIARKAELIYDTGAYATLGPAVSKYGALVSAGPYEIPNVWTDSYSVYTNKMISTAFRSLGTSQPIWAIENHMDIIADELGIDPIEFRLRNVLKDGSMTATGQQLDNVGVRECIMKVKQALEYGSTNKNNRGKGIALTQHLAIHPASSAAMVKINEDGTVNILTSSVDLGQGFKTIISQIAAEILGMRVEDFKVSLPDTDVTPYEDGASSRTTFSMGNAVRLAAMDARQQLLNVASEKMEANPEDLEINDGFIRVRGSPNKKISIQELPLGYREGKPIIGRGAYNEKNIPMDPATGQSSNPVSFWMFAAHGAEVEIDRETGKVKVLKVVSAHDVGKAINPINCEQQIEGAIGMGIGISLMEEIKSENGKTINPNFVDYKMPTAMDMPEMIPILVEIPENKGPFYARGLGEPAVAPTPPAVSNAIYDAVGVRIKELPITPDKVLKALREKR